MKSFIVYYQVAIGRPCAPLSSHKRVVLSTSQYWDYLCLIHSRLTITFGNRAIDLGLAWYLMKGTWLLISITFNLFDPFDCRKVALPSTQTSFEFQGSSDVCFKVVICYCDYSFITDVDDKDHEAI